ncbi:hypothetical protein NSA19_01070 [Actinomyces bowdenii]|uniref:hypothetical protein n=1 Tax=Actinomyces bowdenii TaxID=131109 RepID=UPI00214B3F97|nr:hypothetical protein [Actinomyces bowdenii]MCR2051468.1 hypothetical protein [Actinomyces bowdenii]
MPTLAATVLALGLLADAGMIHPAPTAAAAEQRAATWVTLLEPDMSDAVLGDAVRRVAVGAVEVFGQVKPIDVNRAARTVRAERIRAWRDSHALPTGHRDGFQQSAYLRGFIRAIGNGLDEVEADRHGRAAEAQASQVAAMEPDTPLPEVLARMDRAVNEGRLPWAEALPPARPVAEIVCEPDRPTGDGDGPERARAVLAALARGTGVP